MKRFYTNVSVGIAERGRYTILLDGKAVKTPKRADLVVPSQELADAIAEEWKSQDDEIDPKAMLLTKCANTAVDYTTGNEDGVIDGILAYANDLLCYRAEAPADLVARESEAWDPLLDWFAGRTGVRLRTGAGVAPIRQQEDALETLRTVLAGLGPFVLTPLHAAATLCGSLVLALAILDGRLSGEEAFAVSRLDEDYQAEKWGRDAAAEIRARAVLAELEAMARFMALGKAAV